MAFSTVAGATGAAPLRDFRGHVSYDFDQTQHAAYNLAQVGQAAGAPPGICLALTMAWLQHCRAHRQVRQLQTTAINQPPNSAVYRDLTFAGFVGPNGGGAGAVLNDVVAIFHPVPANWPATVSNLLQGRGFVPQGGLTVLPPVGLAGRIADHRYTILCASAGNAGHAMGILRAGDAARFFDPNHGEIHVASRQDLAEWFYRRFLPNVLKPMIPGPYTDLRAMQFS
jgi:hypothetical protein